MRRLRAGSDVFNTTNADATPFQIERRSAPDGGFNPAGAAIDMPLQTRLLMGEDTTWQLAELIARYLDDTTDLLSSMGVAAAHGDLLAIQRAAHRLKSSSALVGARLLSELCDQLEHALRTNALIDVREHIERIVREFERVRAALLG